MFLFKKMVAPLFYPVPLVLEILLLGLFFLWASRRPRTGKVLVSIGTALLAFLTLAGGPQTLLAPLEQKYPPLLNLSDLQVPAPAKKPESKWIVVLGGGINYDPHLPVTSQISEASLSRVLEGVRLHGEIPGSKLIVSGGKVYYPVPEAQVMAQVAGIMGVKPEDIIMESESLDTEDQARLLKNLLAQDRFILVSSASHMPRAMALFEKQGLEPIPAPAGPLVRQAQGLDPGRFFPASDGLKLTETAVHEYLGLAWAWLRGEL
jgi:uncharacterized SAM-binding protein YcdF (DUF218 family)